jgi:hypothetical protein
MVETKSSYGVHLNGMIMDGRHGFERSPLLPICMNWLGLQLKRLSKTKGNLIAENLYKIRYNSQIQVQNATAAFTAIT